MTVDLPTIRQTVIRKETAVCLTEYLKFRHLVRNIYAFNFLSSSLSVLANDLHDCFEAVSSDLTIFNQFLTQLATDND